MRKVEKNTNTKIQNVFCIEVYMYVYINIEIGKYIVYIKGNFQSYKTLFRAK